MRRPRIVRRLLVASLFAITFWTRGGALRTTPEGLRRVFFQLLTGLAGVPLLFAYELPVLVE